MSTLKTVNIQHPSSASVNAGTDTSGNFLMNSGYGSAATAYGCRAWVNFDGTQVAASMIRASGNVSSMTDNGAGNYTVNFANAMPDANYATNFSNSLTSGTNYWQSFVESQVAGSVTVRLLIANSGTDRSLCLVSVFR